jgi:AraC family transcriptional regulator
MNALIADFPLDDVSMRAGMHLLSATLAEFDRDPVVTRERVFRAASLLGLAPQVDRMTGTLAFPPRKREAVVSYIRDHLDSPIYVTELAEFLDVSTSHFCRAFKTTFGMSTHRYIMEERMARAAELMRETTMSLTDIALEIGMCDQSHLSNLFRRHFGDSPSRWRRAQG